MQHLFLPYHLAVIAKEKGFTGKCLGFYGRSFPLYNFDNFYLQDRQIFGGDIKCNAPLYQQIVDWFREEHKIFVNVLQEDTYYADLEDIPFTKTLLDGRQNYGYSHYYSALNNAVEEAFKLI